MDSSHFSPAYTQAMHDIAALLSLDAAQLMATGSIESEGFHFYFQQHLKGDTTHVSVLAEIDSVPRESETEMFRRLLEANAFVHPEASTYALIPGTQRAALRMSVKLQDGQRNAERVLSLVGKHISACRTARQSVVAQPAREPGGLIDSDLA